MCSWTLQIKTAKIVSEGFMKKLLGILVLGLLFFSNVKAEERESELNNLFKQLKNSEASKSY